MTKNDNDEEILSHVEFFRFNYIFVIVHTTITLLCVSFNGTYSLVYGYLLIWLYIFQVMLFGASDTFSDDKIMQLSCIQPFWNLKVVNLAGYRSNFWTLKIVFDLFF
jgi:hypothetical protein